MDILNSDAPERLPDARRYAQAIGSEVRRLDQLVRDFLTLAREQPSQVEPHGPDAVTADALRLVRAEARRREIALSEHLEADGSVVAIDGNQMKAAILNLLVNAFDAAGPAGQVAVRTSRDNGEVRIAIRDTGPGIPPEVEARMFDPYFTTKPDGTGLGLALTRTVVEQHGGRIEVDSTPDRGTTMTIVLPVNGSEGGHD